MKRNLPKPHQQAYSLDAVGSAISTANGFNAKWSRLAACTAPTLEQRGLCETRLKLRISLSQVYDPEVKYIADVEYVTSLNFRSAAAYHKSFNFRSAPSRLPCYVPPCLRPASSHCPPFFSSVVEFLRSGATWTKVEFLRSGAIWTKVEFLRSGATLSVVEFLRSGAIWTKVEFLRSGSKNPTMQHQESLLLSHSPDAMKPTTSDDVCEYNAKLHKSREATSMTECMFELALSCSYALYTPTKSKSHIS